MRDVDSSALEIIGCAPVKRPDETLLPVRPVLVARPLSVSESEKHKGVEVGPVAYDARKFRDRGRIVEVSLLGRERDFVVGIDKGNEHAAAFRGKLQTPGDLLREKRAGIFVMALVGRLSRIVQEQGEIKHRRILKLLKHRAIPAEFFLFREEDTIKLLDADKSVFVGGITVVKFVLNEAGKGSELGNVAPEETKIVHLAKDATDLAFAGKNREKSLPRNARVLEGAVDKAKTSANGIAQFRAENRAAALARGGRLG